LKTRDARATELVAKGFAALEPSTVSANRAPATKAHAAKR